MKLFYYRIGNVWIGNKYCKLCTFVKEGRFCCSSGSFGNSAHYEKQGRASPIQQG